MDLRPLFIPCPDTIVNKDKSQSSDNNNQNIPNVSDSTVVCIKYYCSKC